jgi:hypothetical protein
MATVNDPFTERMLASLGYTNPPAGIAVILINVGASEPVIVHVDLHDDEKRVFTFDRGTVSFVSKTQPVVSLVSPLDSLQPKVPTTPEEIVRANSLIMSYLHGNKKIQAIKEVRTLLGLGLKEAKDLVDDICQHGLGVQP